MILSTSWHGYPKIFALGHRMINDLLLDDVIVEEKIDGSQFSFGLFDDGLKCRSKGKQLIIDNPEKLFLKAVEVVKEMKLDKGLTYRAEYLAKPKHNALAYDRHPDNHLIIFDINDAEESYLSHEDKTKEAKRLGLETVPKLYEGKIEDSDKIHNLLETISCLGGQKIEGMVIKNYQRFGLDKKVKY